MAKGLVTGAIFCGGKSTRMGRSKAGMKLPSGKTMIRHVFDVLSEACPRVVLAGSKDGVPTELLRQAELIPDNVPDAGPLAGIEALLASGIDNEYLIVPCDLACLDGVLLQLLLGEDVSAPAVLSHFSQDASQEYLEPLIARYSVAQLPAARECLKSGDYSMHHFASMVNAWHVHVPENLRKFLANINRLEDLKAP